MLKQSPLCVRGQGLGRESVLLARTRQELLGQFDDVSWPLTEWRERERHHGQPLVQVSPELLVLDLSDKSAFVALMSQTSSGIGLVEPTGMTCRSSTTLRSLA